MTLIEIMVVLVIMTAIASAVALGVMDALSRANKRDTLTRARTIQAAATGHLLDGGECPQVADLARENILDVTTEHTDAWGNAFHVECEETVVHVRSPGPDEVLGTEDDIGF
jgi:type II secretory pathway pseudopilin PulG